MNSSQRNSKVYLEIVKQLRDMIKNDDLIAGDKIPSERELSERLNVGRSSVREALRALELLGLIETRRGEGTFIRDFREHHLVEVLSTFILQDDQAVKDVSETKNLLEMDSIRLVIKRAEKEELFSFKKWAETTSFTDDDFFKKIVMLSKNRLTLRIWLILKEYYNSLKLHNNEYSKLSYIQLIETLLSRSENEAVSYYQNKLRKLSID
ncbi:FadR family transcriptional regulator [Bacillus aquiflavi]|uniref:FadR family transcriptional regulator n=1 Tax=Bacillus aquiflavi TaxID=2672567 RepID=A0A6B3VYT0_9BACI|nr:GntR family transcriptional regulator [Bacillus aquiflavi]MBA4537110.1 FadR family transcriptional regulator [Bacillus aquiflavi]NEY81407.1 FadR family transcriptional regulator [Bacillus aquiflavi]